MQKYLYTHIAREKNLLHTRSLTAATIKSPAKDINISQYCDKTYAGILNTLMTGAQHYKAAKGVKRCKAIDQCCFDKDKV